MAREAFFLGYCLCRTKAPEAPGRSVTRRDCGALRLSALEGLRARRDALLVVEHDIDGSEQHHVRHADSSVEELGYKRRGNFKLQRGGEDAAELVNDLLKYGTADRDRIQALRLRAARLVVCLLPRIWANVAGSAGR